MEVIDTTIDDVKVVVQQRHGDDRGWFTRAWCSREFAAAGLDSRLVQVNVSSTAVRGTVRGLHRQTGDHAEAKTVYVVAGMILDVAVDLRPGSATFGRYVTAELSSDNGRGLVIPMGFAHGFQALTDDVVMVYAMSEFYAPASEDGVAHDDPQIGIAWPLPVSVLSDRDASLPRLEDRR